MDFHKRISVCMNCPHKTRVSHNKSICDLTVEGKSISQCAETASCPDERYDLLSIQKDATVGAFLRIIERDRQQSLPAGWPTWPNVQEAFRQRFDHAARSIPPYPGDCAGRGIVMVANRAYFASAWVAIKMFRFVGDHSPIELWSLKSDRWEQWKLDALDGLGVTLRTAGDDFKQDAKPYWQLKAYAVLHSAFREVLYIDSDSAPVRHPDVIWNSEEYKTTGAIFFADLRSHGANNLTPDTWRILGMEHREETCWEGGHFFVDKARCWDGLWLSNWMNQRTDYYYHFSPKDFWGDKDTFHACFAKVGRAVKLPATPQWISPAFVQPAFDGAPLFVHRINGKLSLGGEKFTTSTQFDGKRNEKLPLEKEARAFLEELGKRRYAQPAAPSELSVIIRTGGSRCEITSTAIKSIKNAIAAGKVPTTIVIVGNVAPFKGMEGVQLIEDTHNASNGYIGALRNRALQSAKGDAFILVDDDILLDEKFISRLVEYSKTHAWSVLGTRMLHPNGERHFDRAIEGEGAEVLQPYDLDPRHPLIWLAGGIVIMRSFVGVRWAEEHPPKCEDVEFSRRLRVAGYAIHCDPGNTVWHWTPNVEHCESFQKIVGAEPRGAPAPTLPLAGDILAAAIERFGAKRLTAWMASKGVNCGCPERQERINRFHALIRRRLGHL